MTNDPPLARKALLPELIAPMDDIVVAADASPLDFLQAVYRDPAQPMARRMRAAEAALPFVHPKLAVTANIGGEGFAARLEKAVAASGEFQHLAPVDR